MEQSDESFYSILAFFKFGNEENINALYENGTVYLNSIQYFRELEDIELRGDKYEGAIEVLNFPAGDFEIPSINFKGKYRSMHFRKKYDVVMGNIYSLYCVSSFACPNPSDFKIDERVNSFGAQCLFISDVKNFLDRIEKILDELNLNYTCGFVSYYDKFKMNGQVTLFQKPNEFSYQNEFRIYVETDCAQPIILNIGSLKDIGQIIPTSEILALKLVSNKIP